MFLGDRDFVKKKNISKYMGFCVAFALIIVGYIILFVLVQTDNRRTFTMTIDNTSGVDTSNDIEVVVTKSKQWEEARDKRPVFGAQYDGVIKNNMPYNFDRWIMSIDLPCEYHIIESGWNGTYDFAENSIILNPDDFIFTIPAGEEKTFGFIMYTGMELNLEQFIISGHVQKGVRDYALFWILLFASIIWVSSHLMFVMMNARLSRMEKLKENSDKIIAETMETFASLVDAKDPYTKGHSVRVAEYTRRLAEGLGYSEDEVKKLGYIGLMHDCGKIGIPDIVLNKPGKLTDNEYSVISSHTIKGGNIVESFTAIEGIRDGVLYHHERYDGKGYPEGLYGENIPYCARIIGVADSFDAMNSDRVYRKHLSRDMILHELKTHAGTQFDPNVSALMIELIEKGIIKTMDD